MLHSLFFNSMPLCPFNRTILICYWYTFGFLLFLNEFGSLPAPHESISYHDEEEWSFLTSNNLDPCSQDERSHFSSEAPTNSNDDLSREWTECELYLQRQYIKENFLHAWNGYQVMRIDRGY